MKKRAIRKIAAVFLSAAMTMTMMPVMASGAYADTSAQTPAIVQTIETGTATTPLTQSDKEALNNFLDQYDFSAYSEPELTKVKEACEAAKTSLSSAETYADANAALTSFYNTLANTKTSLQKCKKTYITKIKKKSTTGYSASNKKKLKSLKPSYIKKIKAAKSESSVKTYYSKFKASAAKIMTIKQQKALAKTRSTYLAKTRKYKPSGMTAKSKAAVEKLRKKAIAKIKKAKSTSAIKSLYSTFKKDAKAAVQNAAAASGSNVTVTLDSGKKVTVPLGDRNYLYTADGKKVYVGKTYNTSYWGDTQSNRNILVTYIPKMVSAGGGFYNGGNYVLGFDTNHGGVYQCSINTNNNGGQVGYKHNIYYTPVFYDGYGTLITTTNTLTGSQRGMGTIEQGDNCCNNAFSWMGDGWRAAVIQIKKDNITVVESIDGTAPTLDHNYESWTKASTDGKTFHTYQWGMGTAADGTVWDKAPQWIRVYEGTHLIYEKYTVFYSWND